MKPITKTFLATLLLFFITTGIIAQNKYPFHVKVGLENYPDVIVNFYFKTPPSDSLIQSINQFKNTFRTRYVAYMADLEKTENRYMLFCDFQATPYSKTMFNEMVEGISKIKGIEKLLMLEFE